MSAGPAIRRGERVLRLRAAIPHRRLAPQGASGYLVAPDRAPAGPWLPPVLPGVAGEIRRDGRWHGRAAGGIRIAGGLHRAGRCRGADPAGCARIAGAAERAMAGRRRGCGGRVAR